MIIKSTRERFGGEHRLVQYEPDEEGLCRPRLRESDLTEVIDSFYVLQDQLLRSLEIKVMAGEASPLALFMELDRMTADDVAARMRIRKGAVRAHMTPKGFEKASVETLRGYARLFDVSVADFFQFTHLEGEDLSAEVAHSPGRLVQRVTVRRRVD